MAGVPQQIQCYQCGHGPWATKCSVWVTCDKCGERIDVPQAARYAIKSAGAAMQDVKASASMQAPTQERKAKPRFVADDYEYIEARRREIFGGK